MTRIERTTIHMEAKPMPPAALEKMERLFGPAKQSKAQLAKDSFITGFAIGVISKTSLFIAAAMAPLAACPLIGRMAKWNVAKNIFSSSQEIEATSPPQYTTDKWLIMGLAAGAASIGLIALLVYKVYALSIAGTLVGILTTAIHPSVSTKTATNAFVL